MAYADTLPLEEWVATLRPKDIDDLWAKGVHTGDKQYWKNQLSVPPGQWTTQQVDAWENFRRTTSARTAWL